MMAIVLLEAAAGADSAGGAARPGRVTPQRQTSTVRGTRRPQAPHVHALVSVGIFGDGAPAGEECQLLEVAYDII
jgi:hypothetical protein